MTAHGKAWSSGVSQPDGRHSVCSSDILIDCRALFSAAQFEHHVLYIHQLHHPLVDTYILSRIIYQERNFFNSLLLLYHINQQHVDQPSLDHDGPSQPDAQLASPLKRHHASAAIINASRNRYRRTSKSHTRRLDINDIRPARPSRHPRPRCRSRNYKRDAQRPKILHQEHRKQFQQQLGRGKERDEYRVPGARSSDRQACERGNKQGRECNCWIGNTGKRDTWLRGGKRQWNCSLG